MTLSCVLRWPAVSCGFQTYSMTVVCIDACVLFSRRSAKTRRVYMYRTTCTQTLVSRVYVHIVMYYVWPAKCCLAIQNQHHGHLAICRTPVCNESRVIARPYKLLDRCQNGLATSTDIPPACRSNGCIYKFLIQTLTNIM